MDKSVNNIKHNVNGSYIVLSPKKNAFPDRYEFFIVKL